jgi:hypothetical protein
MIFNPINYPHEDDGDEYSSLDMITLLNTLFNINTIIKYLRGCLNIVTIKFNKTKNDNETYDMVHGTVLQIQYINGLQQFRKVHGIESRGFCAMYNNVSKQWIAVKIGFQTSFELLAPKIHEVGNISGHINETENIKKESGMRRFNALDQQISQCFNEENEFDNGYWLTEKIDGCFLGINLYHGEFATIIYNVIMNDKNDTKEERESYKFARILAKKSMEKGVLIVIASNGTFIAGEKNMIDTIVTTFAEEFGNMNYSQIRELAKQKNAIQIFEEFIVDNFISRMISFYDSQDGRGSESLPFCSHFEICNENNTTAWGYKHIELASNNSNMLRCLGIVIDNVFMTHGQIQERISAGMFDQPCYWFYNNPSFAFNMINDFNNIFNGIMSEDDYYQKYPPANIQPSRKKKLQPEGFVVFVVNSDDSLRYFKLKCQVYYWLHKPKECYIKSILELPTFVTNYFPIKIRIDRFFSELNVYLPTFYLFIKNVIDSSCANESITNLLPKKALKFVSGPEASLEKLQKIIANTTNTKKIIHTPIIENLSSQFQIENCDDIVSQIITKIIMNCVIGHTENEIAEFAKNEIVEKGCVYIKLYKICIGDY